MLEQDLATLAATGGIAIVAAAGTAVGTDAWEGLRQAVARWFGRGNTEREQAKLEELDETAEKLHSAADAFSVQEARIEWQAVWRTRIEELLRDLDETERAIAAEKLGELLAQHQGRGSNVSAGVGGLAVGGDVNAPGGVVAVTIDNVTINPPLPGTH